MRFLTLVLFLLGLFGISGCGPGNSSRDLEESQRREIRNEKISELEMAVGRYQGLSVIEHPERIEEAFTLDIFRSTKLVLNPSGIFVQAPTLTGNLYFGSVPTVPIAYTEGDFSAKDRRLFMITAAGTTGVVSSLQAELIDGVLVGEILGGPKGARKIRAERIQP